MNILVTGANGQLGNEMRRVSVSSSNQYIFTDVAELDITNRDVVRKMINTIAASLFNKAVENGLLLVGKLYISYRLCFTV